MGCEVSLGSGRRGMGLLIIILNTLTLYYSGTMYMDIYNKGCEVILGSLGGGGGIQ